MESKQDMESREPLYTQAELNLAMAGAYLDAAEHAKGRPRHTGGYIAPDILARTPADAMAALDRLLADEHSKWGPETEHFKLLLAERDATISGLQGFIEGRAMLLAQRDATIKTYRDAIFDSAAQCGFGARSEDPLSWMVATIERLKAELADAKRVRIGKTNPPPEINLDDEVIT